MDDKDFYKRDTLSTSQSDSETTEIPEKIPERIGPYTVEALLERGGMSILYLGTHPEVKDPITIKVLSPKFLANPDVAQRFLNEADIIAKANHPNIVKLYGQGEWEGGLYIAMEFIEGISLRQYMLRHLMTLKHSMEMVIEIALALCHLHTHGVIHRDLKPENILVTESGKIKVIDFGIAQLLTDKETVSQFPQKNRLIGTPIYMSPEQKENPESVSYPSDIYSLGIITYELVLGKLSHGQIHLSLMPRGLHKILAKALQPKPEDRYQDIVDFITDISTYLNSPSLQKENLEQDNIEELSENLRKAQYLLTPLMPPKWEPILISMAIHKGLFISGFYIDFLELPNEAYGIIMAEPSIKGTEGFIYASILRGMVRSLYSLINTPVHFITTLNELICKDQMNQIFNLCCLVIFPKENQYRFISCGYGNLWHIPKKTQIITKVNSSHLPLGVNSKITFNETSINWDQEDHLFLEAFSTILSDKEEKKFDDKNFQQILFDVQDQPPQKQVDNIMRKIKILFSHSLEGRSIALINVLKN